MAAGAGNETQWRRHRRRIFFWKGPTMKKPYGLLMVCAVVAVVSQAGWAGLVQWTTGAGHNDHWYEVVVADSPISWASGKGSVPAGEYLATITSKEEERLHL